MTTASPTALPRSILLALAAALMSALVAVAATARADAMSDGERGIAEYRKGNLIESMRLLEKSAAAGYPPAQATLAFILDAAEQDARALHWYQRAAANDHPAGLYGLGGMYAKGEGTARDDRKAGRLIGEAARLDHVPAMRTLAQALEHGRLGLTPDPADAAAWYRQAANSGDEISMQRLVEAYSRGQLGLPVDSQQASAWREKLDRGKPQ